MPLPTPTCGLADFTSLTYVTLDGQSPHFENAMANATTAPPVLVSLTVKGDLFRLCPVENFQQEIDWIIKLARNSETLLSVHIATSKTFTNTSPSQAAALKQLGQIFQSRKVGFSVWTTQSHGAVPPFLYGERPITEENVFCLDGDIYHILGGQQ